MLVIFATPLPGQPGLTLTGTVCLGALGALPIFSASETEVFFSWMQSAIPTAHVDNQETEHHFVTMSSDVSSFGTYKKSSFSFRPNVSLDSRFLTTCVPCTGSVAVMLMLQQ